MRPSKKQRDGSGDLFRARLDQIINMKHELVRLAEEIDWDWIHEELSVFYRDSGRPAGQGGYAGKPLCLRRQAV